MTDIDWHYVRGLFANFDFWRAAGTVVTLSVLTWCISLVLGLVLALGKQARLAPVRLAAGTYVWFFRSLPLLVLLIFVYNLPQLLPATSGFLSDPFYAGLVALVANESAYIAEIHRGGLLGIPNGQHEAGRALGIGFLGRLRLIVLPQAFRIALPSLANEFITIVKLTSLVSVISLSELLLVGQRLYTQNFKVLDTLLVVAAFYVAIVTVFNGLSAMLERRLDVTRRRRKAEPMAEPETQRPQGSTCGRAERSRKTRQRWCRSKGSRSDSERNRSYTMSRCGSDKARWCRSSDRRVPARPPWFARSVGCRTSMQDGSGWTAGNGSA